VEIKQVESAGVVAGNKIGSSAILCSIKRSEIYKVEKAGKN
jgi:hypothetical protein